MALQNMEQQLQAAGGSSPLYHKLLSVLENTAQLCYTALAMCSQKLVYLLKSYLTYRNLRECQIRQQLFDNKIFQENYSMSDGSQNNGSIICCNVFSPLSPDHEGIAEEKYGNRKC